MTTLTSEPLMLKPFISPFSREYFFTNHLTEVIKKYHLFIHLSILSAHGWYSFFCHPELISEM